LIVSHATRLVAALERESDCVTLALEKELGETRVHGLHALDRPVWHWPVR